MKHHQSIAATLTTLLFVLLTAPAFAVMQSGEKAPQFTAPASLDGEAFTFSLQQALDDGPVVLYFFPSAFTHGCDIEAHAFAVNKARFAAAGATIIGVSADSIERLNQFSADPDFCAGEFPVASDPTGEIAASYGLEILPPRTGATDVRGVVIKHGYIPRTTFVINGDGTVVATFSSRVDDLTPRQHVDKSLAIVRALQVGRDG